MTIWVVLLVPLALGAVVALLAIADWFERGLLSPQALMRSAIGARRASADHVEQLVTRQCDLLLTSSERPLLADSETPSA